MLPPLKSQAAYLYKYRSIDHPEWIEWLGSIILKNEFYFPIARQLNDPAEACPRLVPVSVRDLVTTLTDNCLLQKPYLTNQGLTREAEIIAVNTRRFGTNLLMGEIINILHSKLGNCRIYSLSKYWNNQHLWQSYAGSHTGYCLEFRNEEPFGPAFDVPYSDTIDLDITNPSSNFLFYKTRAWMKEGEVRVIRERNANAIVPFNQQFLTRLILVKNIASEKEAIIREMASQRKLPVTVVSQNCAVRPYAK